MKKTGSRMRCGFSALIILVLSGAAAGAASPLEPVDTTSPRATFMSFVTGVEEFRRSFENQAPRETYSSAIERVIHCFNLEEVAPAEIEDKSRQTALQLVEILGRIEIPDAGEIPGGPDFNSSEVSKWTIPGTSIAIEKVSAGERSGEYLFSPGSVKNMGAYYRKVKTLAYNDGVWEDALDTYLNLPGPLVPEKWADDIPDPLNFQIRGTPAWKILALLLLTAITVGLAVPSLALERKYVGDPEKFPARKLAGRMVLLVLLLFLIQMYRLAVHDVIGVRGDLQDSIMVITYIGRTFLLILVSMVMFNLLFAALVPLKGRNRRQINPHLLKVIFQLASFLTITYIIVRSVRYLGLDIMPVLAGLGVGGIAVALAARPTLENIIGGLILFADKPVKVNDFCRYGEDMGFVEEIGLRSTRLRKLDDTLVTVPNAQFSQIELQNLTKRRKFLYETTLQFRYETTRDQMKYLLVTIREMLLSHPKVVQDGMRVRFKNFGSHSLDAEVFVHLRAVDWADSLAVREDINFRIMDIVQESGAAFAFPSTTAYIAQDGEIDVERVKKAEKQVTDWEKKKSIPFPYHNRDRMRELKNTLDYPPKGSVES